MPGDDHPVHPGGISRTDHGTQILGILHMIDQQHQQGRFAHLRPLQHLREFDVRVLRHHGGDPLMISTPAEAVQLK